MNLPLREAIARTMISIAAASFCTTACVLAAVSPDGRAVVRNIAGVMTA